MPLSGLSSLFHVGAKTWRPKTTAQTQLEHEKKKYAEETQRRQAEVKQKIELLNHVRKLEATTQALDEMELAAEIRTKEHELAMRERQMAESRQIELAKLELAKRMGQESLNEADLARIRRERMKAELLARASNNHAMQEANRPVGLREMEEHMRNHLPQPPTFLPPENFGTPIANRIPMPRPIPISGPSGSMFMPEPMSMPGYIHFPSQDELAPFNHPDGISMTSNFRSRRMSDSFAGYPGNFRRDEHEPIDAQMAFRAQAERLRRRTLENLDQQARQHNFNAQALRELRQRELISQLREHGIQQRQIDAQVARQSEKDRLLGEAQLRELRDRDYLLRLKEKGLQEREIKDHLRRREESDREFMRKEQRNVERALRRHELMEAEMAIRRAQQRGEKPPLGVTRPSAEEIQREGLLNDIWEEFHELNPRLRQEIISLSGSHKPPGSINGLRSRIPSNSTLNQIHQSRASTPRSFSKSMKGHFDGREAPSNSCLGSQVRDEAHFRSTSRAGARVYDSEPGSRPLSRNNSAHGRNNADKWTAPLGRPSSRGLPHDSSTLYGQGAPSHEYSNEEMERVLRHESLHDATLSARLHSAALNSEINGGRRSRANSRADQANDDFNPMMRQRLDPDSCQNPTDGRSSRAGTTAEPFTNAEDSRRTSNLMGPEFSSNRRSRASTIADSSRESPNLMGPEFGAAPRSRASSITQPFGMSPRSRVISEHPIVGRSPIEKNSHHHVREGLVADNLSRPVSRANMSEKNSERNYAGLTNEELSQLDTEQLEMLVGGREIDDSILGNESLNLGNLTKEEIDQMPLEQIDALLAQLPTSEMNSLNIGRSQSRRMEGRTAHTNGEVSSPSSSSRRQSSMNQGSFEPQRSVSRGGSSSSHQSGLHFGESRCNSHSTSPVTQFNGSSGSNSRSLYNMPGLHDANERDKNFPGNCERPRSSLYQQTQEAPLDEEFIITEMHEQAGARIVQTLGDVEANSQENPNSLNPIDSHRAGLSERNEMHKAVKNLISKASELGANGVLSLRIHDGENGGYKASGKAVILAPS